VQCSVVHNAVHIAVHVSVHAVHSVVQSTLQCTLQCTLQFTLQFSAQCSAVQSRAVKCSAEQCSAVQCSAVNCVVHVWYGRCCGKGTGSGVSRVAIYQLLAVVQSFTFTALHGVTRYTNNTMVSMKGITDETGMASMPAQNKRSGACVRGPGGSSVYVYVYVYACGRTYALHVYTTTAHNHCTKIRVAAWKRLYTS
jgi:hypothetical protein